MKNIIIAVGFIGFFIFIYLIILNPEISEDKYDNIYTCMQRNLELEKDIKEALNSGEKIDDYEYNELLKKCRYLDSL